MTDTPAAPTPARHHPPRRPLIAAGTLLGIGMGGFFDGILFHQILQLHAMLSNRLPKTSIPNIEINMFWDGIFHAFTWLMVLLGLVLLWRAITIHRTPLSGQTLLGSAFLGWGAFNFIEGLIDHQLLQLHHVHQNGNHLFWDMAFLASGLVLGAVGVLLIRGARPAAPAA